MEEYVLRTHNLSKSFGAKFAVSDLNISIRKGDIYGFIGPNGSGKTTAMKTVLGLLTPNSGTIELFGEETNSRSLKKVGSLIESPGLYGDCTAYENMKRFSIISGGDDEEINSLLNFFGLADVGKKKVKAFSLGMKQRLGIAVALLGKPELLILDEPVNALDPMGIKTIRDMILQINKDMGVTFFISSHLLGELEKICTAYGIINKGRLTEEITVEELKSICTNRLYIGCDKPEQAAKLIRENLNAVGNITTGTDYIEIAVDPSLSSEITRTLVLSGVNVSELKNIGISYEDYFLKKMGTYDVGNGIGQYA